MSEKCDDICIHLDIILALDRQTDRQTRLVKHTVISNSCVMQVHITINCCFTNWKCDVQCWHKACCNESMSTASLHIPVSGGSMFVYAASDL